MKRLVAGLFALVAACCGGAQPPAMLDGDIIFQTSQSSQSLAIQRATRSPYSHMGIVLFRNGTPYVLEAAATVRYTPLDTWIARGRGGHYVVKRLVDGTRLLTPGNVSKIRQVANKFEGRSYDSGFA